MFFRSAIKLHYDAAAFSLTQQTISLSEIHKLQLSKIFHILFIQNFHQITINIAAGTATSPSATDTVASASASLCVSQCFDLFTSILLHFLHMK